MRLRSLVLSAAAWLPAHAHEGHGLPGTSHWHAADAWLMFAAAAVVVALLVWARRKP
jgi:hypothetical protein